MPRKPAICRHCGLEWDRPRKSGAAKFCPAPACQEAREKLRAERRKVAQVRYDRSPQGRARRREAARRRAALPPEVQDELAAERAARVEIYAARAERGERLFG